MALSTGNKVLWSDISSLFTRLNTQRTKFGYSTVTQSSLQNSLAKPAVISDLKSYIQGMTSNTFAATAASRYSEITVPTTATLLKPQSLNTVSSILTDLENTCVHNSSFYSGGFFTSFDASFSFNSGFNGGFNNSFGFNSGFNSGFSSSCDYHNPSFTFMGFESCSPYKNSLGGAV